jgi:hypothetical protein
MQRRTSPYLAVGVALLLSNSASALTIINTDSQAGQASGEAWKYDNQPKATEQMLLREAEQSFGSKPNQIRAQPPLPASGPRNIADNHKQTAENMRNLATDSDRWLTPDGQEPRTASPTGDAKTFRQSVDEAVVAESIDDRKQATSQSASGVAQQGAAPVTAAIASTQTYRIAKGWLSEAIEKLADLAGYQMKWTLGENNSADFLIHRDFSLSAKGAREALSRVVEPFPIRICLYQTDRIAQVVSVNIQCQ